MKEIKRLNVIDNNTRGRAINSALPGLFNAFEKELLTVILKEL